MSTIKYGGGHYRWEKAKKKKKKKRNLKIGFFGILTIEILKLEMCSLF